MKFIIGNKKKILMSTFLTMALLITSLVKPEVAEAHNPGAAPPPEIDILPISVYDKDKLVEITLDDVTDYHGKRTGKESSKCPCTVWAFRASQIAIEKLWGDTIPQREDIKIISSVPSGGSMHCFELITANVPKSSDGTLKGEFSIVLPDGSKVEDLSNKNINNLSVNNSEENYTITVIKNSTNESIVLPVKEGVFPEKYFELRKKVHFNKPEAPTNEENEEFIKKWAEVRDKFLTLGAWELFEGIDEPREPFPVVAGSFTIALIVLLGAGYIYALRVRN